MDREKVIKALQNCSVQNDVGCQCCPYFEERKTYGHEWCTTSMAQDALALLKEQEAVKPKKAENPEESEYCCGICGYPLWLDEFYCAHCGRRIEWKGR